MMFIQPFSQLGKYTLLVGMQSSSASLEEQLVRSVSVLPFGPSSASVGVYPECTPLKIRKHVHTRSFIAALSIPPKYWEVPVIQASQTG